MSNTAVSPADDDSGLVADMHREYMKLVNFQKRRMGAQDADAHEAASWVASMEAGRVKGAAPDQFNWIAMGHLVEHDPVEAKAQMKRIRQAARQELHTGRRAAGALGQNLDLWEFVRFQELRAALIKDWNPRNGIEMSLIDTLAVCQTQFLHWMGKVATMTTTESIMDQASIEMREGWEPPRLDAAQAIEQAMAMADRFNRMQLRTLRALRDLRRYSQTVVVQSGGQVNVAAQQVVQNGGSPPTILDSANEPAIV